MKYDFITTVTKFHHSITVISENMALCLSPGFSLNRLYVLHKNGFNGNIWRLTKLMTKAGLTRELHRETGGKGGKLMVPPFSKDHGYPSGRNDIR